MAHRIAYLKNTQEFKKQENDLMQLDEIIKFFKSNKVKITKLNHSLDKSTQRATQYDGFLVLTDDDTFEIILKKPCQNNHYILEADPKVIEVEQKKYEN